MEPKKRSPIQELWPYALIIVGISFLFSGDVSRAGGGLFFILVGIAGKLIPFLPKHQAEKAAAAAASARQAEERRAAEERERAYQAEEAALTETTLFQQLHSQVNELLDLASRIKRDGDNKVALQAMMEVVGSIARQREFKPQHFADEGIAADIRLFLQQLERMGLQDEIVYQRAQRVLQPPPPSKVIRHPAPPPPPAWSWGESERKS